MSWRRLAACALMGWILAAGTRVQAAADEQHRQLTIDSVDVSLNLGDSPFDVGPEPILLWVRRSLDIVTAYYGGYPVRALRIALLPQDGDGVSGGQTFGERGAFIRVRIGRGVTTEQLTNDWVLVHEMTHVALPDVGDEHQWLAEGLAVYVEGVARVQAGNRTQEDVFAEELRAMPRGLPLSGDRGLDRTHTWGRTYWGGAMFCLLADVEIRERTHNAKGLQDAMRAVARASGGIVNSWPIERVLSTADAATGTRVLTELYARLKDSAVSPDLTGLWSELGVERTSTGVRLNDSAPLAPIRRAIMSPPATAGR